MQINPIFSSTLLLGQVSNNEPELMLKCPHQRSNYKQDIRPSEIGFILILIFSNSKTLNSKQLIAARGAVLILQDYHYSFEIGNKPNCQEDFFMASSKLQIQDFNYFHSGKNR